MQGANGHMPDSLGDWGNQRLHSQSPLGGKDGIRGAMERGSGAMEQGSICAKVRGRRGAGEGGGKSEGVRARGWPLE